MIVLPTEKVKAKVNNPRFLIIYGRPKTGKTSCVAALENNLIIDLEGGSEFLDELAVQARTFNDFDDIANVLCYKIGVEEGECKLYNTRDIIEKIQEEVIFFDEREEVISKLLSNHIDLNIFDYAIDNIFTNTESIDIMEPYGDPITGQ